MTDKNTRNCIRPDLQITAICTLYVFKYGEARTKFTPIVANSALSLTKMLKKIQIPILKRWWNAKTAIELPGIIVEAGWLCCILPTAMSIKIL